MEHRYIVTIDVGTSSTKTGLWDDNGALVADAAYSYVLHRPDPLSAEIEGEVWWDAVCSTIRQVLNTGNVDRRQVAGIGVDGVGWTLISVDRNIKGLHPAMIWLDRRAQAETDWIKSLPEADRLVNLVANPIDSAYITPKLLWLKNQRPEIFEATFKFLTCSGFIVARLTGELTCDYTQAYGYHFFDIAAEQWDTWAADRIGIPLEKMPRLCSCTEIVGTITP